MPFAKPVRQKLDRICGKEWVKDDPITLYAYRSDGLTLYTAPPLGVVYPGSTGELVQVVKLFHREQISFLPRGAGTGLSGGAVPHEGSAIIEMARFKEIHEVDFVNRTITVGPGVVNLRISEHVKPHGYHFVPDPSSQKACTIGGNVSENSGGPHTLKYGVTVNHVLGLELVLPDGELVELGGKHHNLPGPDMLGLLIGSEGTFGIITKIVCRLTPNPEKAVTLLGVFGSVRGACDAVSGIIRNGTIPAAMELIDKTVIRAVEATLKPGFPQDAEAVLIVELEDLEDGIEEDAELVERLLRENGAQDVKRAKDEAERARIWRARKESFGAIGQLSPSYYVQDGVIPRSKLPEVVDQIAAIGQKYNLTVANVFHAGDGNLHPLILFDYEDAEQVENTHKVGEEILQVCMGYGGTLSGEHGIGLEKRKLMGELYSEADLENMQNVRAFFNPDGRLNPAKIFPTPSRCAETKRPTQVVSPVGAGHARDLPSDELDRAKLVARKSGIVV